VYPIPFILKSCISSFFCPVDIPTDRIFLLKLILNYNLVMYLKKCLWLLSILKIDISSVFLMKFSFNDGYYFL